MDGRRQQTAIDEDQTLRSACKKARLTQTPITNGAEAYASPVMEPGAWAVASRLIGTDPVRAEFQRWATISQQPNRLRPILPSNGIGASISCYSF